MRISASVGVAAVVGGGVGAGVLRQLRLHSVRQTRPRMGTIVTITVTHPDAGEAGTMVDRAFAEMTRLEGLLTRHRPDAPLGRLNATGRIDGAPPELRAVLAAALGLARRSGGAFDPTVLPVLHAWERARAAGRARPSQTTIESARARVNHEAVVIEGAAISLGDPGMGITLDGIAKGYVVDRTLARLVGDGAERVLVDAGGDMATGGGGSRRDPWTVAVQDPGADAREGVVRLAGGCIATSGDYLHSFTEDRSEHHVIDPRTGRSPPGTSSVSVTAASAMEADGLATTLLVLGARAGLALIDETPGAEALIVGKDGVRARSRGLVMSRG